MKTFLSVVTIGLVLTPVLAADIPGFGLWRAAELEQPNELLQLRRAHVTQLPAVRLEHDRIEFFQQLCARTGDPRAYDAPVPGVAAAADQGALFQAIEQFEVPTTDLVGSGLQHLPAAQGRCSRGAANDERLAEYAEHWFFEEQLCQCPSARLQLFHLLHQTARFAYDVSCHGFRRG